MTSSGMSTAQDVVSFLTAQHEQIKALFGRVASSSGDERRAAFTDLRRLLAIHETAEEEVVHPRARREIDDGDRIVDERLQEENEGKQALGALEALDVDSAEFETGLRELQADVLLHARNEEEQEFVRLAAELDADQLATMRRAVELAESTAPTRPHPGVESGAANVIAGPFAAMLDRARDALSGKS